MLHSGYKMFYGLIISILFAVLCVQALIVVPERAEIHYYNKAFFRNPILNVRRYARRGKYYVNAGVTILHGLGNNVTFQATAYEYLHNEYRPTFIDVHHKMCDFLNNEPYVGKLLKSRGFPCPTPAGTYSLPNISWSMEDFPYLWPFQRIKAQAVAYVNQTILISNASVYFHFINP